MTSIPLGEARDRLSEVITEVERTHERITITKHGRPSVVLIAAEDLEALEETLDILSTPGVLEEIREGETAIERGEVYTFDQVAEERHRRETGGAA